jgi:transcriptional regulatory protein LevR
MTKETNTPLVLVKNFPTRALAEAGLAFLQGQDIEAILQGSDIAGTGMPQGFDLYVQAKDVEKARGMLERLYDGI